MEDGLIWLYILIMMGLFGYGWLGILTLIFYSWQHQAKTTFDDPTSLLFQQADLPHVTVQLPIYNEPFVVKQLIDAAVSLDYPSGKIDFQVIDDSTDRTAALAAEAVRYHQANGVAITYLHRPQREGYKGGALAMASMQATGDFFVLFDADFLPCSDFLQETIGYFADNPRLGFLQARWAHTNAPASSLTQAQAIALDQHFMVEQTVQHRMGMFPKFNGSAGIWRRSCLEDIGGWQTDTICEDLCLSTRAGLHKWTFMFLPTVSAPAELPTTISSFKSQQARWAKGSLQCLIKYARPVLKANHYPLYARIYSLLAMSRYCASLLFILLLIIQLPILILDIQLPQWVSWGGSLTLIPQLTLFLIPQKRLYADWKHRICHIPTLILLVIGISPSQSWAMLSLLFQNDHPFVRTPKGTGRYQPDGHQPLLMEWAAAIYALLGIAISIYLQNAASIPFFIICLCGFGYVIWQSQTVNSIHPVNNV